MILQIADWLMEVSCGNEVANRLQNLKPFLLPEMPVCSRSHICRLELGCKFPIKETAPDVTEAEIIKDLTGTEVHSNEPS